MAMYSTKAVVAADLARFARQRLESVRFEMDERVRHARRRFGNAPLPNKMPHSNKISRSGIMLLGKRYHSPSPVVFLASSRAESAQTVKNDACREQQQ